MALNCFSTGHDLRGDLAMNLQTATATVDANRWSDESASLVFSILVVGPKLARRLALVQLPGAQLAQITLAVTAAEALDLAAAGQPGVVLTGLDLPDQDGLSFLAALRAAAPGAEVVVLDGRPTMAAAIGALQRGAYAYLAWPQPLTVLASVARAAHRLGQLRAGARGRGRGPTSGRGIFPTGEE